MTRRLNAPVLVITLIYALAVAMVTALLFFWVLVVQRFEPQINERISRLGVEWNQFHWFVHSTGVFLFFVVLMALTYLLAVTLSERRYSRKQDEFLSNITHELKSPVAAVKLHAQTLEGGELSPEQQASVGYILRESERVGHLVDNLLEGSRMGQRSLALQPVVLADFFRDYQEAVRGRFDLRQIDLRFEVQTRAAVMTTVEALQRILDNLIDNALRFTGQGGEISLEVKDGPGQTQIVVADNGTGIPKRDLPKIFDRFYRLDREVKGRRRGTGLGLAIVRGLVEEMRGRIRAFSGDGRPGTRFQIELPSQATEQTAAEDTAQTAEDTAQMAEEAMPPADEARSTMP